MSAFAPALGKLSAISELVRLPRQQGTLLLLWPTTWSLVIASSGAPSLKHIVIFTLGTFLMRSAGCAINDLADRKFDPEVERTRTRPLASGALKPAEALVVFAVLSLLAFVLVLQLNTLTIMLSFAGIALAAAYPFVKRVSHFPQVVLGMAFGWGAVMAWSAVRGELSVVPLLIFAANIFWSTAYDTIYALMDKEDDLKIGVKSTAIFFGDRVFKALTMLYFLMFITLGAAGIIEGLGAIYLAGLVLCLVLFLAVVNVVKSNPVRKTANMGFIANAFIGGLLLLFIVLDIC
jgi:4-hydroxybenzoate polyprenyltransferase